MEPETLKQCCARLYQSDLAKLLLGDSFHPGGLKLTERLATVLRITPETRVLDAASGTGSSALFLAERYGCEVVGIDYSAQNVEQANQRDEVKRLAGRLGFERADAESLPLPDASFDAVICECSFCTFPDKSAAASEFARVLRHGGRVGISDVTRGPVLPQELEGLLGWIACLAAARSVDQYAAQLRASGLLVQDIEQHDQALADMVHSIRKRLLGVEIMAGLGKIGLPKVDFASAKQMAVSALTAIQQGQLGYAILSATKL